jgi:hypothetical protein
MHAPPQLPAKPGMRTMALVEPHGRSMLSWLCAGGLVEHGRGDRLMLAQVAHTSLLTRQQSAALRRLLEHFHTLAYSERAPAVCAG